MNQKNKISFSIFLIHALANLWKKSPAEVYKILNDTHIIDTYIFACYDTLHTQGTQALVEDITDFVTEKGIVL